MSYRYTRELIMIKANELLAALADIKEFNELTEADRELVDSLIATITQFQIRGLGDD